MRNSLASQNFYNSYNQVCGQNTLLWIYKTLQLESCLLKNMQIKNHIRIDLYSWIIWLITSNHFIIGYEKVPPVSQAVVSENMSVQKCFDVIFIMCLQYNSWQITSQLANKIHKNLQQPLYQKLYKFVTMLKLHMFIRLCIHIIQACEYFFICSQSATCIPYKVVACLQCVLMVIAMYASYLLYLTIHVIQLCAKQCLTSKHIYYNLLTGTWLRV